MCDTLVALSNSTADGSVLFAKNSDRYPNEAHHILILPAKDYKEAGKVKCTYIEIPQVRHTHAILLAKPYWIWGAEMGANEKGVVIGNEAVFSKEPYGKEPGLIGMDFLRLALERADTAWKAMHTIIELLDCYGQSGVSGLGDPKYYHNSFLIVDRKEAWVIETSGKHWVAEKVVDIRSISNTYTIHNKWDLASDDIIDFAVRRGWCKGQQEFDFSDTYSDLIYSKFSDGRRRHTCSSEWMNMHKGVLSAKSIMRLLRSHGSAPEAVARSDWFPDRSLMGQDICAHAGFGPIRISQTTGSIVSILSPGLDTHWVTATSAPCTGIYKPLWIDTGLPDLGDVPGRTYDNSSLWWQHELLHREVIRNYYARLNSYRDDRDLMEDEFQLRIKNEIQLESRGEISRICFNEARNATLKWLERIRGINGQKMRFYYRHAWNALNRNAKITLDEGGIA